MSSKAQVQVTFHWIYVVLAGAVILLFFAGMVVRQKSVAEKELTSEVVRIMESILAGAGVSEKTKNVIDTSGLADLALYFSCTEGVGEFGILDGSSRAQNARDPLFAPQVIKSPQLVAWSLPYAFPFKVIDFLYVTAPTIKYAVFSLNPSNDLFDDFEEEFRDVGNVVRLQTPDAYASLASEEYFHVRVVTDVADLHLQSVPLQLRSLDDEEVSLVELLEEKAVYYQKKGTMWQQRGEVEIFSLGNGDDFSDGMGDSSAKDPAVFAAIFAGTPEQYRCNMQKALWRLELLVPLYQKKEERLEWHYIGEGESTGTCMNFLTSNSARKNIEDTLTHLKESAEGCRRGSAGSCTELIAVARELRILNKEMGLDCIPLY
ncbi:hypothetical protein HYX13_00945 [Candidatus Woesearchaeota archaeon]|nr:hypothetical protein [Candidatus Woesearchaeota archaeon]